MMNLLSFLGFTHTQSFDIMARVLVKENISLDKAYMRNQILMLNLIKVDFKRRKNWLSGLSVPDRLLDY
jgi:hypothetical protein